MDTKPTFPSAPSTATTTGAGSNETLRALEHRIEILQGRNDPAREPEIDQLDREAAAIIEAQIHASLGPERERLVDALKRAKELVGDQW
jgi:hypothetical protein